jgi:diaminohydroxyphosphoribosylaminopyrimidine deaminase/5-amino-6-(5-phosphoribosylamino)uracil reductase
MLKHKNMDSHEIYMHRCLTLAKNGLGYTCPNPLVGCVIVYEGRIIGEGWHQKAGEAHAEVNAINAVKDQDLLPQATLYVNLEPCSHHGRTPPCADLIIKKKIKKVVIGVIDANEKVKGKGALRLKKNGVEVVSGVLQEECRELNKRFFTFHEKGRPYVILKWAQSADAYIFSDPKKAKKGAPLWISNAYSRQRVHQWRAQEASILVGKNTVLQDNPRLNTRDLAGNDIVRMVIDKDLTVPLGSQIYDGKFDTIIYNEKKEGSEGKLKHVQLDFSREIVTQILSDLHQNNIQSLIVEGGAYTLNKFLDSGLWDEARIFCGNKNFGGGIKAPVMRLKAVKEENILDDHLFWYTNTK